MFGLKKHKNDVFFLFLNNFNVLILEIKNK